MPLSELLNYYAPFATERAETAGIPVLSSPEVNVLGLNAAYLPQECPTLPAELLNWFQEREHPPLVLSDRVWPGEEVTGLRVGEYRPSRQARTDGVVVEQVSRLQLPQWSGVLAASHGTPHWAGAIARFFAAPLEHSADTLLLLAYAEHEPVGALLWKAGAAHLWGTLDPAFDGPLLDAAAALNGGRVRTSLPDSSPLRLPEEKVLVFTLLPARLTLSPENGAPR